VEKLDSRHLPKIDEIKSVLNFYDLGELKTTRRVDLGVVNDNWLIETVRGRYFLKRRHPELKNTELIRGQHELIQHLRLRGFPAPAVIPTRKGETLLILDGEFYEIQEFIEGKPYEQANEAHFMAAAIALGLYHAYVRNFISQDLCYVDRLYCPTVLTSNLFTLSEELAFYQDLPFADVIEALTSHAIDLSSRLSSYEQLPRLVIHGDYHADNLIFNNDCIVGVVDYDKARLQPRVVELAEALIYFASPRSCKMKHLVYSGFLEWDRFTRFLKYYADALRSPNKKVVLHIRPVQPAPDILVRASCESAWLGEDEVCALPDYIRSIWLSVSVEQLLVRRFQTTGIKEFLRELLALSDWASTHRQRLIEAGHAAIRASESTGTGLSSF
jgi:homoserine kinase type II